MIRELQHSNSKAIFVITYNPLKWQQGTFRHLDIEAIAYQEITIFMFTECSLQLKITDAQCARFLKVDRDKFLDTFGLRLRYFVYALLDNLSTEMSNSHSFP